MEEIIYEKNEKLIELEFRDGLKKGIPIALGYFAVSMTFGIVAVKGGISPFLATLISLTNLTSAGQFAGVEAILNGATYIELILATIIINIRYSLMSFSVGQKLQDLSFIKRLIVAFGITDEVYTVAAVEEKKLSFKYMIGLISIPYIAWGAGTLLGAISANIMPLDLKDALGIALYGMFIAIIVPACKKNKNIFLGVIISSLISIAFFYVPCLKNVSSGFVIIIASLIGACIMAKIKGEYDE